MLLHGLSWAQMPEAVGSESGPGQVGVGTSGAVPFMLRDGYLIVVEGRIGAQGHLKLVLDTGATHSVLRPDLAKEQMSLRRTVRIVNLDHVLTQELAEVPDFELGPIRIPLLPVMLNDLSYLRESAPGVDGLIGLDVLQGRSFSIDFGRRKITFGSPRTLRFSATMEVNEAYLAVEVQILNRSGAAPFGHGSECDSALPRSLGRSIAGTESGATDSRGKSGRSRVPGGRHAAVRTVERHRLGEARSVVAKLAIRASAAHRRLLVADRPGSSALQLRLREEHL